MSWKDLVVQALLHLERSSLDQARPMLISCVHRAYRFLESSEFWHSSERLESFLLGLPKTQEQSSLRRVMHTSPPKISACESSHAL